MKQSVTLMALALWDHRQVQIIPGILFRALIITNGFLAKKPGLETRESPWKSRSRVQTSSWKHVRIHQITKHTDVRLLRRVAQHFRCPHKGTSSQSRTKQNGQQETPQLRALHARKGWEQNRIVLVDGCPESEKFSQAALTCGKV